MEQAIEFLEKNGFKKESEMVWSNKKCLVYISDGGRFVMEDYYCVTSFGDTMESEYMYSLDLNIYWLIGVLTYYDLIDRNFVK
jgi:hypothetical protein